MVEAALQPPAVRRFPQAQSVSFAQFAPSRLAGAHDFFERPSLYAASLA
jgi:hypothetical protein